MSNWHLACGYRYAGVHCGLRPDPHRLDLALIVSDTPASAAGVFTQNRVVAAPVRVCRERLPRPDARGVVICSGNANACTGEQGLKDARCMTSLSGQALGFVLTDASVLPDDLNVIARKSAERSFNCITVEGHTSTNDSLVFFANGQGPRLNGQGLAHFENAATAVCVDLAQAIIADAEGASHFVTRAVEGLRDDAEARTIAKVIAESALVKTALFGA